MVVSIGAADPRCHPDPEKILHVRNELQSDSYLPQQQMELAIDTLV